MVKKLSCVSCGSLKRFPHTGAKVYLSIPTAKERVQNKYAKKSVNIPNVKMQTKCPTVIRGPWKTLPSV